MSERQIDCILDTLKLKHCTDSAEAILDSDVHFVAFDENVTKAVVLLLMIYCLLTAIIVCRGSVFGPCLLFSVLSSFTSSW